MNIIACLFLVSIVLILVMSISVHVETDEPDEVGIAKRLRKNLMNWKLIKTIKTGKVQTFST